MLEKIMHKGDEYFPNLVGKKVSIRKNTIWAVENHDGSMTTHSSHIFYSDTAGKKFKIAQDVWFIKGADPIINLPNAADAVWMKVSNHTVGEKVFFKGIVMTDFFKDGIKYLIFQADKNQEVYRKLNFQFGKINPYYEQYFTDWDNQAYMVDASRVIWGGKALCTRILARFATAFRKVVVAC